MLLISKGACNTVEPRFTGPRFTGTPIYREDNLPPKLEIYSSWPRYTGHPDLPGKTLSPKDPGKSGSDCITNIYAMESAFMIRNITVYTAC